MPGGRVELVAEGDLLTVDGENAVREAVNGLLRMDVDPATMEIQWAGSQPLLRATAASPLTHFWTTGTITASASAGTTVSTATLTQGSGNARRCVYDDSASKYKPNVAAGAADETIYNDVSASIASGQFVLCAFVDSRWVVILANCGA